MVMGEYLTLLTSTGATCRFRQRKRARQVLVAPWKHEEWVLRQHIGDEVDHSYCTHVDAPGHYHDHYFDAGFDVDTLDLEVLNGNWLNKILSLYILLKISNQEKHTNIIFFNYWLHWAGLQQHKDAPNIDTLRYS
jgi:hypothetical protein